MQSPSVVMRTGSSSKRWLHEHVTDKWVKDAQKDGYRSRAAYKLLQVGCIELAYLLGTT
jgi:hypothetical protein